MGEVKKEANLFRLVPLETTQDGARLLREDVLEDKMNSFGKSPKFQFLRTSSMTS